VSDEEYYAVAVAEFESGNWDAALLAKAHALACGDTSAEEFEYIRLRVAKLESQNLKFAAQSGVNTGWQILKRGWQILKTVVLWWVGLSLVWWGGVDG
jgi:hypothetical protein